MVSKSLIQPELRRVLAPPFAWIDRHFLFDGFLAHLSQGENLLYFFLTLAADRDGLSFYRYDKICQLLQLSVDDYIWARDGLLQKKLIAFDGQQFQLLRLPHRQSKFIKQPDRINEVKSLAEIFSVLAEQK
ncbi:MAG: hypothetical protein JSW07_11185 [bacterium]|nr:MAG: hypothetical protein JSW07_11185 [bacterium]